MKKFIHGKWFPLTVACIVLVLLAFVMFLFGWRITYAPEMGNNWDAVSAVAAWVSACATLAAVWAAIQIPKEIAKQQNRISLIKDRLEIKQVITEVSNDIISLRGFSDVDIKTWDVSEELPIIFSFATLSKYEKKKKIIDRYPLYFTDYSTCAEQLSEVYHEISWAYFLVERFKGKRSYLFDLAEIVEGATEFVRSKEFREFKKYMSDTIKVSK